MTSVGRRSPVRNHWRRLRRVSWPAWWTIGAMSGRSNGATGRRPKGQLANAVRPSGTSPGTYWTMPGGDRGPQPLTRQTGVAGSTRSPPGLAAGGQVGHADPTRRRAAEACPLEIEVEWADAPPGGQNLLVDAVRWHQPRHFELQSVRISGVQGFRRAVVGGSGHCTGRLQRTGDARHLVERVHLPGQVVQADGGPAGARRASGRAHLE